MRVGLTFDCEHPDGTPNVLGVHSILHRLHDAGARATFFIQGRWGRAYPDEVRAISEGGHLLGNHSFYHTPLPMLTSRGRVLDLQHADGTVLAITGKRTRPWFRPPFGKTVPLPEGWKNVLWDVSYDDWKQPDRAKVVDNVVPNLRDGSIVLFHNWPAVTEPALDIILERLPDVSWVGIDHLPCPGNCYICGEDIPCALPRFHDGDCTAVADE